MYQCGRRMAVLAELGKVVLMVSGSIPIIWVFEFGALNWVVLFFFPSFFQFLFFFSASFLFFTRSRAAPLSCRFSSLGKYNFYGVWTLYSRWRLAVQMSFQTTTAKKTLSTSNANTAATACAKKHCRRAMQITFVTTSAKKH